MQDFNSKFGLVIGVLFKQQPIGVANVVCPNAHTQPRFKIIQPYLEKLVLRFGGNERVDESRAFTLARQVQILSFMKHFAKIAHDEHVQVQIHSSVLIENLESHNVGLILKMAELVPVKMRGHVNVLDCYAGVCF